MQLVGHLDDYLVGQMVVHLPTPPHLGLIHWGLLVERQLPKLNVEGSNPFARFVGDGWRGSGVRSVERDVAGAKSVPCLGAGCDPCI